MAGKLTCRAMVLEVKGEANVTIADGQAPLRTKYETNYLALCDDCVGFVLGRYAFG